LQIIASATAVTPQRHFQLLQLHCRTVLYGWHTPLPPPPPVSPPSFPSTPPPSRSPFAPAAHLPAYRKAPTYQEHSFTHRRCTWATSSYSAKWVSASSDRLKRSKPTDAHLAEYLLGHPCTVKFLLTPPCQTQRRRCVLTWRFLARCNSQMADWPIRPVGPRGHEGPLALRGRSGPMVPYAATWGHAEPAGSFSHTGPIRAQGFTIHDERPFTNQGNATHTRNSHLQMLRAAVAQCARVAPRNNNFGGRHGCNKLEPT
jgi:hypothetical protein